MKLKAKPMTMESLAETLINSGKKLMSDFSDNKCSIYSLKKLKDYELPPFIQQGNDETIRYFSFYIIMFFNDVFYNLAGDLPYEKNAHAIKNEFFFEVGKIIIEIGNSLKKQDPTSAQRNLIVLNSMYLDTIDKVNSILDGRIFYGD